MTKEPKQKRSLSPSLGIPRVLEAIHYEKISEVIPVKVQFSVKNCLKRIAKKQGVSAWVREAIIMRLREEAR